MTNDPKLKLAMARLLSELILIIEPESDSVDYGNSEQFKWKNSNGEHPDDWFDVTEQEWFYVMHLVEQTLTKEQCYRYSELVGANLGTWRPDDGICNWPIHATFNQRATAMCKVKGI